MGKVDKYWGKVDGYWCEHGHGRAIRHARMLNATPERYRGGMTEPHEHGWSTEYLATQDPDPELLPALESVEEIEPYEAATPVDENLYGGTPQ